MTSTSLSVLIVCTANICRSPLGVALLQDALGGSGIRVRGAGTLAAVGHPPVPEAVDYVRRYTGMRLGGAALQLDRRGAESAELILTMTQRQRAEVVQTAPSVMRRTFTLRQFVRIASLLPEGTTYPSVRSLTESLAQHRALAGPAVGGGDDIPDPYGETWKVYEESFDLIARTVDIAAAVLMTRVVDSGGRLAGPVLEHGDLG